MPIDWDSVEFTATTVIDASGSDITDDHTVWHVWVLDESGSSDENATAGPTPVFIEDVPVQVDTSLTYDYTRAADATATGTAQLVHTEHGGRYYNADGTLSVGTYSVTTTTNLVTGESTTQTTSTFPAYVPVPTTGGTTGGDNDGIFAAAFNGLGQGLAATADGFLPFVDPFESYYDPADPTLQWSSFLGGVSRDLLLAAAIPNLSQWVKNPFMYELGSTTIPGRLFKILEHLTPIQRGEAIFRQLGWRGFCLNGSATAADWSATVGHWSGLTPGGKLLMIGVLHGLDWWFTGEPNEP